MNVADFLEYLRKEKRYSEHTIKSYQSDLAQFAEFLQREFEISEPAEVNAICVRSWIVKLSEDGVGPRSINRKISSLKGYFKYLRSFHGLEENPMQKIIAPKVSKRLPHFVESARLLDLFEKIEFPAGFEGSRDRLLMDLLYSSGMRLSELVGLKESDIDFGNSTLKVLGKGNKVRILPLTKELLHALQDYLDLKRSLETQSDSLLVLDSGKPLYPKFVYRKVNHYIGLVSTQEKKSPHVLRHSFATHMLNNGADINAIKEILGHANLSATQVYTHASFEKLKSVYKQAHPRA